MKALILAAGFGTRLLPYTGYLPKPLFTISGRPLLDIHIRNLEAAGCRAVAINTHHLHRKIENFISNQHYRIPVIMRYEPEIHGTGGAIGNFRDFWDNEPFMVINSDIYTDIDFREVYNFHLSHPHPATLVMYDDSEFNTVCVNEHSFINGFSKRCTLHSALCTFTGIQVLDPEILDLIPERVFSSSIDAFRKLMQQGKHIKAFMATDCSWKDLGTPERYRDTAIEEIGIAAFRQAYPKASHRQIVRTELNGDGSDRKWYRLVSGEHSLILADHGIRQSDATQEADSFIDIGQHLYRQGIAVPKIHCYDRFSGLVVSEDVGDIHLQTAVRYAKNDAEIVSLYCSVIDDMITMSVRGRENFQPSWTYQTPEYDREVILQRECRYFTEAFLNGYLGLKITFEELRDEFEFLADQILEYAITGFMHRDFQSRNIMIQHHKCYFIDFQGGRIGPIQYDLASLLIDPYVDLNEDIREKLLNYCIERLGADEMRFRKGYKYCCISRNLQMLGAFGYLSRVKQKAFFEQYIPIAFNGLKYRLSKFGQSRLKQAVETAIFG